MGKLSTIWYSIQAYGCLTILMCLGTLSAYSQFGNEWINDGQQYYKIKIGEEGVYRLTYDDLQQAGFPVTSVDPRRMQLFFRGQEQAILVNGQQDARLDAQDYLLFYGERNDGTQDTELYIAPEAQPHPYYNLHSDTTAYFLTWRLDTGVGRRMSTFSENNITNIAAEPYHLQEELLVLTDEYSPGRQYPIGSTSGAISRLSIFDYGEGWTGPRLKKGETVDYTLSINNTVPSGPPPRLEVQLVGRNTQQHRVTVQVGSNAASLRTLTDVSFEYYDNYLLSEPLAWSDLGAGQFTVRLTVNGANGEADNVSVSYVKLTYAQGFDAQSADHAFHLRENNSGKSYLTINNPSPESILLDISSTNAPQQIGYNVSGNQLTTIVPGTQTARQLWLGAPQPVPSVRRVSWEALDPTADFLIITHPEMRRAARSYADPVTSYQNYRTSPEGGNFNVAVLNIEEVYDRFGYGEITPLAIRRLGRYWLSKGSPQYLLLIGKGLTVDYNHYRKKPTEVSVPNLVPTGGWPGSDILFTAGLGDSDGTTAGIPTGRINAQTAQEVANYLDKVKQQEGRSLADDYAAESTREALWKKRLVHLSGGVTAAELTLFARYVDQFEQIAEGDYLGGQVNTQSKTTNNATELINIADEVNKGVSLITFFGHSSTTRTDIEIGYASNDELGYRNQGKYPAILLNGCSAGNVFTNTSTFGENWIATQNRGALHVIAHSYLGLSSILRRYTNTFYQTAFADSALIDQSMGRIKTAAGKRFLAEAGGALWEGYTAQVQQLVLQGDPSVVLFGRGLPDYDISQDQVQIAPLEEPLVTASSDSFAVDLVVRNFGRMGQDSIAVTLNRTLSDGSVVSYGPQRFPAVRYEDTLRFIVSSAEVATSPAQSFGDNQFEIFIDSEEATREINEDNNRATLNVFVPNSGTVNLLPYNYAIVNQMSVKLQVQPGLLQQALQNESPREYLLELDTSAQFSSPVRQQTSLSATTLARWSVDLPVTQDSTVYYWRSKYAVPQEGEVENWTQSSFVYIQDSPGGWAQQQSTQFLENQVTGMIYTDRWEFEETSLNIAVEAYGSARTEPPSVVIEGKNFIVSNVRELQCRENSINGVAFDRNSLLPYLAVKRPIADFNDRNSCGPFPKVINTFDNSQITNSGMLTQYIDAVANGDPVLLFSIGQLNFPDWDAAILTKLSEIGVATTDLDDLQTGEPIIILGRKNAAEGTATVVRGNATEGASAAEMMVSLEEQVTGQFSQGTVYAQRIGPATAWTFLQTNILAEDNDAFTLSVIGETLNGQTAVLLEEVSAQNQTDLSGIDARQYPYLRLQWTTRDEADFTPAQLQQWLVTYTGVPEGMLLTIHADEAIPIEKQEGESLALTGQFFNLSEGNFTDSLAVVYTLRNTVGSETDTLRLAPLAAGDTATFTLPISTVGRAGSNDVLINVNPRLQPEQTYTNNRINLIDFFRVSSEVSRPVIDVAFDGAYVEDGAVISPNPLVAIAVHGQNALLPQRDTTGVAIYFGHMAKDSVGGAPLPRVYFSDETMCWTPATGEEPFQVDFQPTALEDGLYTLRVQTSDARPYEINVRVVNEVSLTLFHPAPNPLTTHTRFTFTVTGTQVPEQFSLQIMNLTGQVIKTVTQDQLPPLRIGTNYYLWDGTNGAGALLPNGLYLYRMMISPSLPRGNISSEKALSGGIGKVYIMR